MKLIHTLMKLFLGLAIIYGLSFVVKQSNHEMKIGYAVSGLIADQFGAKKEEAEFAANFGGTVVASYGATAGAILFAETGATVGLIGGPLGAAVGAGFGFL